MGILQNKTVFITGGSRGIGRALALKLASLGANIILAAKTDSPHPKLAGTLQTVADEVRALGARVSTFTLDVRDENSIEKCMAEAAQQFDGIDILINNASAIYMLNTEDLSAKQLDLMWQINGRGSFLCSKAAIPFLKHSSHAHILNLSPPISLEPKWFKKHVAYTISKYMMSMTTLGLSAELASLNIAVNSLWPQTTIATAAIEHNFPAAVLRASRQPEIVADAAASILSQSPKTTTGQFFIDEAVLRADGVTDFAKYQSHPELTPIKDLYLD